MFLGFKFKIDSQAMQNTFSGFRLNYFFDSRALMVLVLTELTIKIAAVF